jgi:predicted ABC-type sugar transport system permease subunit
LVGLLNSAAIPIVLRMGATFIILMGSIDLSLEGVVALAAVAVTMDRGKVLVIKWEPVRPGAEGPCA